MDLIANLALGFETALTPVNIFWCFIGVLLGTLVGVLPGIGPTATIAMLLPITFTFSPVTALIMLSGIYYGAQYGGSTTAILINLPGESSSAVTAIDGYQMARKDEQAPPSPRRRSAPSSPDPWRRCFWPSPRRRWRASRSISVRPNISHSSSSAFWSPFRLPTAPSRRRSG